MKLVIALAFEGHNEKKNIGGAHRKVAGGRPAAGGGAPVPRVGCWRRCTTSASLPPPPPVHYYTLSVRRARW